MRGAVPCLSVDLTTHAVPNFHHAVFENGKALNDLLDKRRLVAVGADRFA
jgi:hypothetical protein